MKYTKGGFGFILRRQNRRRRLQNLNWDTATVFLGLLQICLYVDEKENGRTVQLLKLLPKPAILVQQANPVPIPLPSCSILDVVPNSFNFSLCDSLSRSQMKRLGSCSNSQGPRPYGTQGRVMSTFESATTVFPFLGFIFSSERRI